MKQTQSRINNDQMESSVCQDQSGVTIRPRRRRRPPLQQQQQQQKQQSSPQKQPQSNASTFDGVVVATHDNINTRVGLQEKYTKEIELLSSSIKSLSTADVSNYVNDDDDIKNNDHNNEWNYDELVQQFHTSVQTTTQASTFTSLCNNNNNCPTLLVRHIIMTSMQTFNIPPMNHPKEMNGNKDRRHQRQNDLTVSLSMPSLLLEDHAMEILSTCRTLVKEANDNTNSCNSSSSNKKKVTTNCKTKPKVCDTTTSNDDRLFVAIHGLRAILHTHYVTNINSSKIDTIRRLLYFCMICFPTNTTSTGTTTPTTSTDTTTVRQRTNVDRNFLCYIAYHALGHTMQGYTFYINDALYQCKIITSTDTDHPSMTTLFPIPQSGQHTIHQSTTETVRPTATNGTEMDQICTMCIVASLTIARQIVTYLQNHGTYGNENNENDPRNDSYYDTTGNHILSLFQDRSNHNVPLYYDPILEVRYFVLQVAVPWIRTLAMYKNQPTTETTDTTPTTYEQNIVSYCKKGQRILYDLAETAMIVNNPTDRLLIQADSIHALLLDGTIQTKQIENNIDTKTLIIGTIFLLPQNIYDMACTYAWKISDSYYSTIGKTTTTTMNITTETDKNNKNYTLPLNIFHERVGTLFDSFMTVTTHNDDEDDIVSDTTSKRSPVTSYIEYCAYRAFHTNYHNQNNHKHCHRISTTCSKNDCLFHQFPYLYIHYPSSSVQVQSYNADEAMLLVFFLSRYIRYGLEYESVHSSNQTIDLPTVHSIVQEFRWHYVSETIHVDQTKRLRWYNLLSSLGLHRAVHRILDNQNKSNDFHIKHLDTARIILTECMAPLCVGLLDNVSSDKQRSQLWTCITSCYRLSISITEESRDIEVSNECIAEFTSIVMTQTFQPASDVMESTAKFLYSVGKKRFERDTKHDALFPLLHSIKILIHGMSFFTPVIISSLKIPGRLMFIATIYKSLDMIDESIITMFLALTFDVIDVSIVNPSSTNQTSDLFSWLASFTENIVVIDPSGSTQTLRSEQRVSLQSSLLQLMLKRRRSPMVVDMVGTKNGATKPSTFVDLLLASLNDQISESFDAKFEKLCCMPFNLATIISSVISNKAVPRQNGIVKSKVILEFIKMLTEFIVRFGNLLQCTKRVLTEDSAASIADYHTICRFTESLISKLEVDENVTLPLIAGMMNLVASISLLSNHPSFKFERWITDSFSMKNNQKSIEYIDSAKKLVDRGHSTLSDYKFGDLLSSATISALELYRYQLSHMKGGNLSHMNLHRLQDFCEEADLSTSVKSNQLLNWRLCLTTTLSRLCTLLHLEGEGLRALQVAKWNCTVNCDSGNEGSSWFESIMLTLLTESSIVSIRSKCTESFPHPVNIEEQACRLRLYTRDASAHSSLRSVESQLQRLLDSLQNFSDNLQSNVDDLVNWSSTTIYLGLSECAERRGSLEVSMQFLKKCFDRCRTTLSALKRRKLGSEGIHPFWYNAAQSYLSLGCMKRQVKCLYRTALLYHRMGNYRKSIEYSFSALNSPVLDEAGLTAKSSFAESVAMTRQCPALSSSETKMRRLFLRLKSLACPLDFVTDQFRKKEDHLHLSLVSFVTGSTELFVNVELETIGDMYEIVDMINGYQMFPSRCAEITLQQLAAKRFVRYSLYGDAAKLLRNVTSLAKCSDEPYLQLQYNAKLRDAAEVLTANSTVEKHKIAIEWLNDIVASPSCSALCRAWSYYLLGSASLKSAKRNGDVQKKWNLESNSESNSLLLEEARCHFTQALQLLGTSCDLLKRNVQRCLAITIGSGSMNDCEALDCFCLINDSVGGWIKSQLINLVAHDKDTANSIKSETKELFDATNDIADITIHRTFSTDFLEDLGELVPREWRFITAASSPTGELLLSSLEFSDLGEPIYFNACVGPESFQAPELSPTADIFDKIVKPLNEIVARSEQQLSGECLVDSGDETSKEGGTRRWWHSRKQLDSDLQQHLSQVESALLSSNTVQRVLLGNHLSDALNDSAEACDDLPCGNLASRFEAATDGINVNRKSERRKTTRSDRSPFSGEMKRDHTSLCIESSHLKLKQWSEQECIFLILDENLVAFPFEGLSCFSGKSICRLPSLSFALAKLSEFGNEQRSRSINPHRTSYILDPESNLSGTKDRLAPFLDSLQNKFDYQWNNIIGETPSAPFMESSLLENDGLLLYFGHGGGQQFYGRGKLESLARHEKRSLSSVILMGCGSGKLESVNTKNSKSMNKLPIHYEPEGVAMSYLLAGSPCVVGNLWDVTDRDIDRYSLTMLQLIYDNPDGSNKSIAQSVSDARHVCKMQYIVGCAPVCYGFPMIVSEE